MIVVDEYLAARVMGGDWPPDLPEDDLVLTPTRHWRLLQALHGGRGGQLSRLLAPLSPAGRDAIRHPHPTVLQVLDPRPLLDQAAAVAARFGGTGLLVAESLVAGLEHGQRLLFGNRDNVRMMLASLDWLEERLVGLDFSQRSTSSASVMLPAEGSTQEPRVISASALDSPAKASALAWQRTVSPATRREPSCQ